MLFYLQKINMDRHIIVPLDEEYEKIEIRVSNIEQFYWCQYKYKYEDKKISSNEALVLGNCINSVVQTSLYDEEKGREVTRLLCKNFPQHCEYFNWCMGLIADYKSKYEIITNEMKMIVEVELGKYLLILEWTMDLLFKSKETGGYVLADLKTSKSEWTEETYQRKIQKYMYTFLFQKLAPVERFDYLIMTKHAMPSDKRPNNPWPRFQIMSYVPDNEQLADFVDNLLINYVEAVLSDQYIANKNVQKPNGEMGINPACWYCELKKAGMCPERQEKEHKDFIPY